MDVGGGWRRGAIVRTYPLASVEDCYSPVFFQAADTALLTLIFHWSHAVYPS